MSGFAASVTLVIMALSLSQKSILGTNNVFIEVVKESSNSPETNSSKVTLIATGDIIPARSVNVQAVNRKDFKWAFANIAPILSSADITLINLESPLLPDCPLTTEGFVFCGSDKHIQGLTYAGIDIVNVANNHFSNYGQEGIDKTKALLEQNNMQLSGLPEQPIYKTVNGTKFAFLGYNDIARYEGIANFDLELMKSQLTTANANSDIVVVSMHWGIEYVSEPNSRQKELAHFLIDNGADLVIGNHPHWVQSEEYYKGKYIKYAHGNTIFDQMWSEETKKGVIGKYTFENKELTSVEFVPTYIVDYGQPTLTNETKQ